MHELLSLYTTTLSKIPILVLVMLAAISVIIGDYAAKSWSMNQNGMYLAIAFAGYFFSGFFYIPTLLREGLIVTSVMWGLLSTVGFLVIGLIIFKETLSLTQTVAVTLGIVSILILTIFD